MKGLSLANNLLCFSFHFCQYGCVSKEKKSKSIDFFSFSMCYPEYLSLPFRTWQILRCLKSLILLHKSNTFSQILQPYFASGKVFMLLASCFDSHCISHDLPLLWRNIS
jgi:hypothetical protein